LIALKKKHSKTGEESRYQGTVLGIKAENKAVKIEGGHAESIQAWEAQLRGAKKPLGATTLNIPPAASEDEKSTSMNEG
jgi:transcription initiation factor TFIID subunit 3